MGIGAILKNKRTIARARVSSGGVAACSINESAQVKMDLDGLKQMHITKITKKIS